MAVMDWRPPRPLRSGVRKPAMGLACTTALLSPAPVLAQSLIDNVFPDPGILRTLALNAGSPEIALAAGLAGAVMFAAVTGAGLIRVRKKYAAESAALQVELRDLRAHMDQIETLLASDDQRQLIWQAPGRSPLSYGTLPAAAHTPKSDSAFLAFGNWLTAESAAILDSNISALQRAGTGFRSNLRTKSGNFVEAIGRLAGGRPAVAFRSVGAGQEDLALMGEAYARQQADLETAQGLLEAAPGPAWIRGQNGKLSWVNAAYADAVGEPERDKILNDGIELLDSAGRAAVRKGHAGEARYQGRLPVTVGGKRRIFDLTDIANGGGSGGFAVDMTELEEAHGKLKRTIDSHERTLNQLQSAVAIFGPNHRLQFYNAAYREMWSLDTQFLDSGPLDSDILDALRARRQLPEQANFRNWKADLLAAYRDHDGMEDRWHLPDGRIVRVLANPHPQGGVTCVFENITEQMKLESRYNALAQVQGETLDNLSEGVAVFGSDGRLTLWNPAFTKIWALDDDHLVTKPHVSAVIDACKPVYEGDDDWNTILKSVAGLDETRQPESRKMARDDGMILTFAIVPLPDGGTMVTFTDVTASVNVERALRDKTDALEEAHAIKNTFVQHVSYEMRSPLTNIIGFAQLLSEPRTGELTEKQREYTDYILSSSSALLAIINDVLDLATIDAGIMALELVEIDVGKTIEAVTEAVQDRLSESGISLETRIQPTLAGFVADEKRLRQVLFNLITNAIRFSDSGCTITIACESDGDRVLFTVSDDGLGISREILDSVFGRFVSHGTQARRRGAGLGLSIVKSFVELHGGSVDIDSREGEGTLVRCNFPRRPQTSEIAAE
ncbi:MAG: PAS-domain containing protein [Pseudomonadota bacterium]